MFHVEYNQIERPFSIAYQFDQGIWYKLQHPKPWYSK